MPGGLPINALSGSTDCCCCLVGTTGVLTARSGGPCTVRSIELFWTEECEDEEAAGAGVAPHLPHIQPPRLAFLCVPGPESLELEEFMLAARPGFVMRGGSGRPMLERR